MKTKFFKFFMAALAVLMSGCADKNASYVQPGGASTIISTRKINIADWNSAASKLTSNLLASGTLDRLGLKQPIKMLVSTVRNNTSEVINTSMLTDRIIMDLTNTGKVIAINNDRATQDLAQSEAKISGKRIDPAKITLTGSISEDREANSDKREVTYTFTLQLNMDGVSRWIGTEQITKQSDISLFGL